MDSLEDLLSWDSRVAWLSSKLQLSCMILHGVLLIETNIKCCMKNGQILSQPISHTYQSGWWTGVLKGKFTRRQDDVEMRDGYHLRDKFPWISCISALPLSRNTDSFHSEQFVHAYLKTWMKEIVFSLGQRVNLFTVQDNKELMKNYAENLRKIFFN